MTKHLDLGCGTKPRNPYQRSELYGVDIRPAHSGLYGAKEIRASNLSVAPIPYDDDSFESVSAYDFLEHVPRTAINFALGDTHFPFITLMNEIWRVLKNGGLFYSVAPAYPHGLAFADPTHVNIMTTKTLRYFSGAEPMGRMYGFKGRFEVIRQTRIHPRGDFQPTHPSIKLRLKMTADAVMRRRSHLLWELRAVK
jgi:SAM-dependent methyltransferase